MKMIGIFKGGERLKDLALQHGTISIGRDDSNVITLQDPAVSGHHAKIINILNLSYIQDLGSSSGTYVNGKRVDKHTLYDGDSIQIGGHKLVFVSDENKKPSAEPAANSEEDSDETVTISREEFDAYFAKHASENQVEETVKSASVQASSSAVAATAANPVAAMPVREPETITATAARPATKQAIPMREAAPVTAAKSTAKPNVSTVVAERIGEPAIQKSTRPRPQPEKHRTVTTKPQKTGEVASRPSHVQARINTRKNQVQANASPDTSTQTAEKSLEQMIEQPTLPKWFIAASSIAILCMIIFFVYVL